MAKKTSTPKKGSPWKVAPRKESPKKGQAFGDDNQASGTTAREANMAAAGHIPSSPRIQPQPNLNQKLDIIQDNLVDLIDCNDAV